ncbi:hypothetical protein [Streptomyces sp. TS71-3]|uniref:hypothetical protein n=1 Tax=Streptomyces sp. TS71-3 TaxID=2733862 RepID=UPI001B1D953F|nr:hypothetical protein Sm713_35780 [Streptomyces sp. TS71-3]
MTICATEASAGSDDKPFRRPSVECTLSADGTYAARLVRGGPVRDGFQRIEVARDGYTRGGPERRPSALAPDGRAPGAGAPGSGSGPQWFPERWTLDGPEPYRVALPARRPEQQTSEVLPMGDGRVLIHRTHGHRHVFALLHPTSPGTREIPLGSMDCPVAPDAPGDLGCAAVRLLPPPPGGRRAYALAVGARSTAVWLVAGGFSSPRAVAELPGRCTGGAWLERTGRLLAVDQEHEGRTKTVTVDLRRGGEVSPLLEITEGSTDRLLLADPDSGLLLIRSDAPSPGHERLAWGVLGGTLPVRFPECLRLPDCAITPFAIQPGLALTPERCAVALRIDGAAGTWLGMWRPGERTLHHVPAPEGWLTGCGAWTREGMLHLPYATGTVPCGLARLPAPPPGPGPGRPPSRTARGTAADTRTGARAVAGAWVRAVPASAPDGARPAAVPGAVPGALPGPRFGGGRPAAGSGPLPAPSRPPAGARRPLAGRGEPVPDGTGTLPGAPSVGRGPLPDGVGSLASGGGPLAGGGGPLAGGIGPRPVYRDVPGGTADAAAPPERNRLGVPGGVPSPRGAFRPVPLQEAPLQSGPQYARQGTPLGEAPSLGRRAAG